MINVINKALTKSWKLSSDVTKIELALSRGFLLLVLVLNFHVFNNTASVTDI